MYVTCDGLVLVNAVPSNLSRRDSRCVAAVARRWQSVGEGHGGFAENAGGQRQVTAREQVPYFMQ